MVQYYSLILEEKKSKCFVKPGPRCWFIVTAYKEIPADFELPLWKRQKHN